MLDFDTKKLFSNSHVCQFYSLKRNPRVPCKSLPSIDLELWKERVSCTVGSTNIEIGKADRISPCVMCTCTREGVISVDCTSFKYLQR